MYIPDEMDELWVIIFHFPGGLRIVWSDFGFTLILDARAFLFLLHAFNVHLRRKNLMKVMSL